MAKRKSRRSHSHSHSHSRTALVVPTEEDIEVLLRNPEVHRAMLAYVLTSLRLQTAVLKASGFNSVERTRPVPAPAPDPRRTPPRRPRHDEDGFEEEAD